MVALGTHPSPLFCYVSLGPHRLGSTVPATPRGAAALEGRAHAATAAARQAPQRCPTRRAAAPPAPRHPQVPSAVFAQPPLGTVGLTEQEAVERLKGDIDVYISKFKPMKNTMRWVYGWVEVF